MKASRSRGCGESPCRIKYAIREWRRFVLTAVTGSPAMLIRRLPNKLIRMDADYVVYDFPVRGGHALSHKEEWIASMRPAF